MKDLDGIQYNRDSAESRAAESTRDGAVTGLYDPAQGEKFRGAVNFFTPPLNRAAAAAQMGRTFALKPVAGVGQRH
jgi:hypothetical protein